jgi:pSer/pThr/pTyr-binding forkhead associated (FHA) protein
MPRVTITIADRNPQPYRFQLDRMKVNMGRGSDNDIVIDDGSASVRHAVMERIDGGYQLRDLGSTNGIKLDGEKSEIIPLRHGLSVKIGDVAFDFTLTEEEREALAREKPQQESPIVKEDFTKAALPKPAGGPARPAPAPAARPVIYESQPSASASFFMTLFFLVLAAGAFWLGLSMRYSNRTKGASLMHDLQGSAAGVPIPAPDAAKPAGEGPAPAPAPEPAK